MINVVIIIMRPLISGDPDRDILIIDRRFIAGSMNLLFYLICTRR